MKVQKSPDFDEETDPRSDIKITIGNVTQDLFINLLNINDNDPVFEGTTIKCEVQVS